LALVLEYHDCTKIRIYEKDVCCECVDIVALLRHSFADVLIAK
jgi:hypothetical protein